MNICKVEPDIRCMLGALGGLTAVCVIVTALRGLDAGVILFWVLFAVSAGVHVHVI